MSLFKVSRWLLPAIFFIVGIGYYVLYTQKTINGNVNINKIEGIDKIYSYSVHSDFYYHVMKYDENGKSVIASYAKLIPLKTSIGYDFTDDIGKPKTTLTTVKAGSVSCFEDTNGRDIERYIKTFNNYAKIFGSIVATQDQSYFNKSAKKVESILVKLYGNDIKLSAQDIEKYYTSVKNPVLNMKIKYYKLTEINKNLKSFKYIQNDGEWQPNIAEWRFNENDRIYLQFLNKVRNNDLYDYLKTDEAKDDALIVKTVKINGGKIEKIYFKIKTKENKIECLFEDSNGYRYTLIMSTQAKGALRKYLPDFLKIAYGINFIDVKNFNNWFAKKQDEVQSYFNDIDDVIKKIQQVIEELQELGINPSELKKYEKYQRIEGGKFDERMYLFKNKYGTYPSEKKYIEFNRVYEELKLKQREKEREIIEYEKVKEEAISKLDGFFTNGEDELNNECPQLSLNCMKGVIDRE